jgi:Tfp pilus assembly protein PilF
MIMGVADHDAADYAAASIRYGHALEHYRAVGEARGIAHVLNNLGAIAWREGRWGDAWTLHEEALAQAGPLGDPSIRALALVNLGLVGVRLRRSDEAAHHLREGLRLIETHGLRRHVAAALEAAAALLAARHQSSRAARLYGAGANCRRELETPPERAWVEAHASALDGLGRDLGEERSTLERYAGQSMSWRMALDEALRGLEPLDPESR